MGDIKGLIDLAPEDLDEQEAMRLTQRLMSGRFTLNDMYQQMEMMSKIGTLGGFSPIFPTACLVWVRCLLLKRGRCRVILRDTG